MSPVSFAFLEMTWPGTWGLALIAGVALVAAYVLLIRVGGRLFGPIFFYELIRLTRRNRYFWLRFGFVVALLLLLYSAFDRFQTAPTPNPGPRARLVRTGPAGLAAAWPPPISSSPLTLEARRMSRFAEEFYQSFLSLLFIVIVVVTPAYTAGAIAEEKQRRTMEFLLATDLTNREIVLGKLAARVATLGLLLMSSLPILALTQLWGGVEPNLVLGGYVACAVTLLSLASLSIWISVIGSKPLDAIVFSYLVAFLYVGLSFACGRAFPDLSFGNPWLALERVQAVLSSTTITISTTTAIFWITAEYAVFHLAIAYFCCWAAITKMRQKVLAMPSKPIRVSFRLSAVPRFRPSVGKWPVLWKEVHVEPTFSYSWFGRAILGGIILVSILPGLWMLYRYYLDWTHVGSNFAIRPMQTRMLAREFSYYSNSWVRLAGTMVALLTLVSVGLRAATTISGERDKQGWDCLLTTRLGSRELLYGKWLGSLLSVRWALVWLGLIWGLGILTGGLYIYAAIILLVAWLVYAALLTFLGLWFSMTCKTSFQASLWTLGVTILIGGLPWLLLVAGGDWLPMDHSGIAFWISDTRIHFDLRGLSPPLVFGWLAFPSGGILPFQSGAESLNLIDALEQGMIFWIFGTAFLVWRTSERCRKLTGRAPLRRGKPLQ